LIGARINIQVSKENTSTQSSLDMNLFEGGWTIEGETYKLSKYYENDKIGDYYKTKITQSVGISIPCFGYTIFDTDDVIGIERIYANIDEYNNHLLPEKIIISIEKNNPSLLSEENLQCVVDGAFNLLSPLKDIDYTGMDCIKIIYVFYPKQYESILANKAPKLYHLCKQTQLNTSIIDVFSRSYTVFSTMPVYFEIKGGKIEEISFGIGLKVAGIGISYQIKNTEIFRYTLEKGCIWSNGIVIPTVKHAPPGWYFNMSDYIDSNYNLSSILEEILNSIVSTSCGLILECPANATLIDEYGHIAGYYNGTFINEIENCSMLFLDNGSLEIYAFPSDLNISVIITGYENAIYNISYFVYDNDTINVYMIRNATLTNTTMDQLNINKTKKTIEFISSDNNKNLIFSIKSAGEMQREYEVNVNISNETKSIISIDSWDNPTTVSFGIEEKENETVNEFPVASFSWILSTANVINFTDLSYDIDGYITNYTWDFGDGSISYKQNPSHKYADDGIYNITLTVIDNNGATASITKQILIENDAPVALSDSITTDEDTPIFINVSQNDYDIDGTIDLGSIIIVDYPSHGSLEIYANGTVKYTPNENYYGNDEFNYTIKDNDGAVSNVATVYITILPVNNPPVASDDYATVEEDSSDNQIDVLANDTDVDKDSLEIVSVSSPLHGTVYHDGNYVYYAPNEDYYGIDSFTYTITDGLATDTATVYITIIPVNDPPMMPHSPHPANGATNIAITTTLTWQCSDIDNDTITYDVYFGTSTNPPKVASNITSNSYSPGMLQYSTIYYWRIVAWDEHGAKNESDLWHFTTEGYAPPPPPPNHPPTVAIIHPENGATVSGTIMIQGKASDEDGNETIQKIEIKIDDKDWTQATGTTSWSYEWNTTQAGKGNHTIYVWAYDGKDYSNIVSVNVNVFINHKPFIEIIEPENGSIVEKSIIIKGKAWDVDGNESIVKVEVKIDDGEWVLANGTILWSYLWNITKIKNGKYEIKVRAWDGVNYSNIISIMVEVKRKKGIPGFEILAIVTAIAVILLKRKLTFPKA
ncbi:MAG: tandem-95 repeat protein, partial [Thermoplasmata archaeon]